MANKYDNELNAYYIKFAIEVVRHGGDFPKVIYSSKCDEICSRFYIVTLTLL